MSLADNDPSAKTPSRRRLRPVGRHYDGDLRTVLVVAAATLVDQVGPDQLSLRAVSAAAGVSHAAPGHHFGDRRGLLSAVAVAGFEQFTDLLDQALTRTEPVEDPIDQWYALTHAYVGFANAHPGQFALMFQPHLVDGDDPELAAAAAAAFDALLTAVDRAQATGWRTDVDRVDLAMAAWSFAHGIASLLGQRSSRRLSATTPEQAVERIVGALLG